MRGYLIDTSLLQSELAKGTAGALVKINKVIREAKGDRDLVLTMRGFEGVGVVIGWADAAWANRTDGSSTGGLVIGVASPDAEKGIRTPIGIITAATHKLKRVARGSLGAEIQGLTNLEEEMVMVRAGWYEYTVGNRI